MTASRAQPRVGWGRTALLALAAAVAALMIRDWMRDPFDATRTGTDAYGHNHPHALIHGLSAVAVECALVYLAVAARSSRRSIGRSAGALAVLLPWTLLSAILSMHAGGIVLIHLMWVVVLLAVLLAVTSWRVIARLASKPPSR